MGSISGLLLVIAHILPMLKHVWVPMGSRRYLKITNCKFSGAAFTPDILRLNYQGIGVFSREADGNSHYSLGAYHYDTNTLHGQQAGISFLHKAYRREGTINAAGDAGSHLQIGPSLSFSTFSGQTSDTPVAAWSDRFAVYEIGGIGIIRVNANVMGWSDAIPTSGTWTKGDVVWNTLVASGGSTGWICITSGTPGTWKAIAPAN